jgi:hypothetical protein
MSGNQNCLKIKAHGRTSADTFRVGAKGKDRANQGLFQDGGRQTTGLNLDLTLNAEHQFGGE